MYFVVKIKLQMYKEYMLAQTAPNQVISYNLYKNWTYSFIEFLINFTNWRLFSKRTKLAVNYCIIIEYTFSMAEQLNSEMLEMDFSSHLTSQALP